MDKPKKILISIPYAPYEKIEPNLMKWVLKMITYYNYENFGKFILSLDLCEGKPIDSNRNKCMNNFLNTDCDYILTIDADIVPPDNCIEELVKHNKDIVGATCFSFQYGYPWAVILDKVDGGYSQVKFDSGERLIECKATGAACVLIKRDVIVNMKEYLLETTGKTMFYESKYNEHGELSWGQDFWFCENALNCGYKIFVDTALLCGHFVSRLDLKRVNDILVSEQKKGSLNVSPYIPSQ